MSKKIVSLLLVLALLFSLGAPAFAESGETPEPEIPEPEITEPAEELPLPEEPAPEGPDDGGSAPEDPEPTAAPEEEPEAQTEDDVIASGSCGENVNYVLDSAGVLTISGEGEMTSAPDLSEADKAWVRTLKVLDGVTNVYDNTCRDCANLTAIELAPSVRTIGDHAFFVCTGLSSVSIPDGVTSIGSDAFYYCTGLRSVSIPGSVTSIGIGAFYNCTGLSSVSIPGSVTTIGSSAFLRCIGLERLDIADGVTEIGGSAFADCTSLSSVSIPDSVTRIGANAFCGCVSLTDMTVLSPGCVIDSSAYTLGVKGTTVIHCYTDSSAERYARDCGFAFDLLDVGAAILASGSCGENVNYVLDSQGVLTISGEGEMTSAPDLSDADKALVRTLKVLDGVTNVYDNTCKDCANLTAIELAPSVTEIGYYAFSGCRSLSSVSIPGSVTTIGDNAFSGCTGLESLDLADGVTTIGPAAFSDCTGLSSVSIPGSVTEIGGYAFSDCTGLSSMSIPASVTSIGEDAFSGCTGLADMTVLSSGCTIADSEDTLGVKGTTVIRGYAGSTAESYAQKNGFTFATLVVDASGSCGENVNYVLDSAGVLTVSGSGSMTSAPDLGGNKDKVRTLKVLDGVTNVYARAFCNCTELTAVELAPSVRTIGEGAFSGCAGLTDVTILNPECVIEDSADALGVKGKTMIHGYDGSTAESYAQNYGFAFESLGVVVVVFGSCGENVNYALDSAGVLTISGLGSMTSAPDLGDRKDKVRTLKVQLGVSRIYDSAFEDFTNLTAIELPRGSFEGGRYVIWIGRRAFKGCTGLRSVNFPFPVYEIGESAFSGCSGLTQLTFEYDGSQEIDERAFENCTALSRVSIPGSTYSIGADAFRNCVSLTDMIVLNPTCAIAGSAGTLGVKGTTVIHGYTGSTAERCAQSNGFSFDADPLGFGVVASGPCGENVNYTLDELGVLTVSGTGSWTSGCLVDRDKVYTLKVLDGVTNVYNRACLTTPNLTAIELAPSVTTIESYAFSDCPSLSSVSIPASVTTIGEGAFYNCTGLESLDLADGVTTIEERAFEGCTSLGGVSIPGSVTTIEPWAFSGCTGLESLDLADGVTEILNQVFSDCTALSSVSFPASVDAIGWRAFSGCTGLADVTVLNPACVIDSWEDTLGVKGTTVIHGYAGSTAESYAQSNGFSFASLDVPVSGSCGENVNYALDDQGVLSIFGSGEMTSAPDLSGSQDKVRTLKVLDGVLNVYDNTCGDCTGLTAIELAPSVRTIGENAFSGCTALSSVSIPSSVRTIGEGAFSGCAGLTDVTVLDPECEIGSAADTLGVKGTTTIHGYTGSTAESYAQSNGFSFESLGAGVIASGSCGGYVNYTLDDQGVLTVFGSGSMTSAPDLSGREDKVRTLKVLDGVLNVYDGICEDCANLTAIELAPSVMTIGGSAFSGCTSLSSVSISSSVFSIGTGAFSGCTGLSSVSISPSVTTIGSGAFEGCTGLESVSIPASVTNIWNGAFSGCTGLTDVTVLNPECRIDGSADTLGVKGTTTIHGYTGSTAESYAQSNGFSFESFGAGVIASGSCGGYVNYTLDDQGVLTISGAGEMTSSPRLSNADEARVRTLKVLDGVTNVYDGICEGCANLTTIELAPSVLTIGSYAFEGCHSLSSVSIPASVTRIGNYAFWFCTSLSSVSISASVIGDYAFWQCPALSSVSISASVASIGKNAFANCPSLADVTVLSPECRIDSAMITLGVRGKTRIHGYTNSTAERYARSNGFAFNSLGAGVIVSGSCGEDVNYTLDTLGVLTVSGSGSMTSAPSLGEKKSKVRTLKVLDGVTNVYDNTCKGCTNLTAIELAPSVLTIGENAFSGCTGLGSVNIPASVTGIGDGAFSACTGLADVTVLNLECEIGSAEDTLGVKGTTTIHGYTGSTAESYAQNYGFTFESLGVLTLASGSCGKDVNYTLDSAGVLTISGKGSMTSAPNLSDADKARVRTLKVLDGVLNVYDNTCSDSHGYSLFTNLTAIELASSVLTIGENAFSGCTGLEEVTIPSVVNTVGDNAFSYCSGLTRLTIEDGVGQIGDGAFSACTSLGSVSIPGSVNIIGGAAFSGCTGLKSLTIADGVTEIGSSAFADCTSLSSVSVPGSVTNIGYASFCECTGLESLTIADGVTEIGSHAFEGCIGLSSVAIPGSVTSIGNSAFEGCTGLESVSIADGVTDIWEGAFSGCVSLTEMTIPSSVNRIWEGCFSACVSLADVTVLNPECRIYNSTDTLGVRGRTTIHGYTNSTAESYANTYKFTFESIGVFATLGDVTGDGELDLQDVTLLFQAVNKQAGADVSLDVGDVNGDKKLDLQDVTLLFQFVNGQISALR